MELFTALSSRKHFYKIAAASALIWGAGLPVFAQDVSELPVRIAAGRINVRTSEGTWKCTVDRRSAANMTAVARHADGERIKVRLNAKGCPSEGYIYSNFLRPVISGAESVEASVEPDELALRSKPSPNSAYTCGLPKNSKVQIVEDSVPGASTSSWVKVKMSPAREGCPEEGYVNGSYLKPSYDFGKLPLEISSIAETLDRTNTEAGTCETGDCNKGNANANLNDLKTVTDVAGRQLPPKGSYWDSLKEMIRNPRKKPASNLKVNRGLVQLPLEGSRGNIGPCGSFHYSPDKPKGVDVYTNPLTACAFSSVLQDWKKNSCPSNSAGCRISFGDISHKTRPLFNTHRTHTDGQCIDIRPMRKGGFVDAGMNYGSSRCVKRKNGRCVKYGGGLNPQYDQDKTRELVQKLKAAGGTQVYFNDTSTGSGPMSGHSNHIHVCFKNTKQVRETCDNFVPDLNVCPELQ